MTMNTPFESFSWHDAVIESIAIHPAVRVTGQVVENAEQLPDVFVSLHLTADNQRGQLVLQRCRELHLDFGMELQIAVVREKQGVRVLWNKDVPSVASFCESAEWTCGPISRS